MARLRLPLGMIGNGVGAIAPTFVLVPGSFQPVTPNVLGPDGPLTGVALSALAGINATVLADVPDEDVSNGQLDPQKVKARYPDHPYVKNGTIK